MLKLLCVALVIDCTVGYLSSVNKKAHTFDVKHLVKPPHSRGFPEASEKKISSSSLLPAASSYLDELSLFRSADKKTLVGFTVDAWNIGQRKYKNFLAVHRMIKQVTKSSTACVEIPMWEVAQGPHYEDLQQLLEVCMYLYVYARACIFANENILFTLCSETLLCFHLFSNSFPPPLFHPHFTLHSFFHSPSSSTHTHTPQTKYKKCPDFQKINPNRLSGFPT